MVGSSLVDCTILWDHQVDVNFLAAIVTYRKILVFQT